jgi:PAS domain S-box-containing protein
MSSILVVEDENLLAKDLVRSLSAMGYHISGKAASGEEAMRIVKETKPDLIIMDIMLSGELHGIETANLISSEFDIPVIYLTGYSQSDLLERAKQTIPYGYLSKPVSLSELRSAIETALYRHESDKRLRDSERLRQTLMESMAEGLIYQDASFIIRSYNSSAQHMLGMPIDKVVGKSSFHIGWNIVKEDGSPLPVEEHPSTITLRTGKPISERIMGVKTGTGLKWITVNTRPLFRPGEGLPYAVVISFSEITEIKRTEHALRKSEELFRNIFRKHRATMLLIEPESGRILDANRAAISFYGYDREKLLNMSIQEINILAPDNVAQERKRALFEENNYFVFPHRLASGEIRTVEARSSPIEYGGRVILFSIINDITERKIAEQALTDSERRHRDLVANLNEVIFSTDTEGELLYISPPAQRVLGYDPSEMIGSNFTTFVHPDDLQEVLEEFQSVLNHKISPTVFRVRSKSGDYKWIRTSSRPLTQDSEVIGLTGVATDITQSKRAQDNLELERKLLQDILEATLAGYWDWDMKNNTAYLSPRFKKMFGYEDHELPNTPESWQSLIFPEDLPGVLDLFERHVKSGGRIPYYNQVRYRHKDGSTIWVICAGRVVEWDEKGDPLRMVGCHVDITKLKNTEQELLESREILTAFFDAEHVGAAISMVRNGEYLEVNPGFEKITGYSREELIGSTSRQLGFFTPSQRDEMLYQIRKKGRLYGEELVFRNKSGEDRTIIFSIGPVHIRNEECLLATMVDITERKIAETKIMKALKEKEILVREVHHRVKNNMAVIASLLNMQSQFAKDSYHEGMFHDCQARIRSMSLVHEMLYRSDNLSEIDAREYVSRLVNQVASSLTILGQRISLNHDIEEISISLNKAISLGFILTELISNCYKHAFKGESTGSILVSLRRLNEKELELKVRDNGSGLPRDIDPANPLTLGLDLVDTFVRQLNGEMKVKGREGTEILISFPN